MSYKRRACLIVAAVAAFSASSGAAPPVGAATFAVQDTVVNDTIKVTPQIDGVVGLPISFSAAGLKPTSVESRPLTLSQTSDAPFLVGPTSVGPVAAPIITLSGTPSFSQYGTYTVNWSLVNDTLGTTTTSTSVVIHNLLPPTGVKAFYASLPSNVPIRNASGVITYLVWDGTAAEADPVSWNGYRVRRNIHGISTEAWEVAGQFTNLVTIFQNNTSKVVKTPTSPLCLNLTQPCVPDSFVFSGTGLFFRGFRSNSLGNGKYVLDYPPGAPVDECSTCWVFIDLATIAGFSTDYRVTSITASNGNDFVETPLASSPIVSVTPGTPTTSNLEHVAVVPNPFKGRAEWDPAVGEGRIHFIHLPEGATVRIFTASAELVRELTLDSQRNPGGTTGELEWDLRNGKGQKVVSGIYVYQVESKEGRTRKGHFVIIK
jgi:hypothetical protein